MESDLNAREMGFSRGIGFDNADEGKILLSASLKDLIDKEIFSLNETTKKLKSKYDLINRKYEIYKNKNSSLLNLIHDIQAEHEKHPSEYSLVKGIIYLFLSILLVLADVPILGQAAAHFLRLKDISEGVSFSEAILKFSDFSQTLNKYPHLIALTFSVLLIGLYFKVWIDVAGQLLEDYKSLTFYKKLYFWINTTLLILSIFMIIFMSFSRFTLNFGGNVSFFANIVAVFIGITLPLVSVGFFVKGADCLGKRVRLWQYLLKQFIIDILLNRVSIKKHEYENILTELTDQLSKKTAVNYYEQEIAKRNIEFMEGYFSGIWEIIGNKDEKSISDRIKPLLIKEYLR